MKALQTMLAIAVMSSISTMSYAGRCDGNNGNGKGNQCEPVGGTPPATTPTTPQVETDREYIERVHTYVHGNSQGIQHLAGRDAQQQTEIDSLSANKVDKTVFYADQQRQDSRMNAQDVRNDSQDTHINNVQNAAQIANEKADSGAVRMDGIEGSVRETNTQLAITDGRSINNAVRLDGVEGHNARQDASIDALNDQAQVINNTINNHGDTLSSHQQQIDQMGSRMSNEIAGAMNRANEAHKEAKTAQDQAAAALSVAGMQFDLNYNGFQTAISAASFGGSTALSVGAGGKISERIFVNAAITNAGSATGGVVSSTFRW